MGHFSAWWAAPMIMLEFNKSKRSVLVEQHHQQRLDSIFCNHVRGNDPTSGGPLVAVGLPPRALPAWPRLTVGVRYVRPSAIASRFVFPVYKRESDFGLRSPRGPKEPCLSLCMLSHSTSSDQVLLCVPCLLASFPGNSPPRPRIESVTSTLFGTLEV